MDVAIHTEGRELKAECGRTDEWMTLKVWLDGHKTGDLAIFVSDDPYTGLSKDQLERITAIINERKPPRER